MAVWRPTEIELVKELAAKGVSAQRIAARVRRTSRAVVTLGKTLGIRVQNTSDVRQSFGLGARYHAPYSPDPR